MSNDRLLPWKRPFSKGINHRNLTQLLAHLEHWKWYGCVLWGDMVGDGVLVHGRYGGGHHDDDDRNDNKK